MVSHSETPISFPTNFSNSAKLLITTFAVPGSVFTIRCYLYVTPLLHNVQVFLGAVERRFPLVGLLFYNKVNGSVLTSKVDHFFWTYNTFSKYRAFIALIAFRS